MTYKGESSSVMTAKWAANWKIDGHELGVAGAIGYYCMSADRVMKSDFLAIVKNTNAVEFDLYQSGPGAHNEITALLRGPTLLNRIRDDKEEWRIVMGYEEIAVLPKPVMKPWPLLANPIRYFPTDLLEQAGVDLDALVWEKWSDWLDANADLSKVPADIAMAMGAKQPQVQESRAEVKSQYSVPELVDMLAKELNKTPKEIYQRLYA